MLCSTMSSNKKSAFTLMEVLVAVAVLGLVAVGALKLSATATKTLDEVAFQVDFLNRVRLVEMEILSGSQSDNGENDGLKWRSRSYSYPLMGGLWEVRFRQLEFVLDGRTMTLYLP